MLLTVFPDHIHCYRIKFDHSGEIAYRVWICTSVQTGYNGSEASITTIIEDENIAAPDEHLEVFFILEFLYYLDLMLLDSSGHPYHSLLTLLDLLEWAFH